MTAFSAWVHIITHYLTKLRMCIQNNTNPETNKAWMPLLMNTANLHACKWGCIHTHDVVAAVLVTTH